MSVVIQPFSRLNCQDPHCKQTFVNLRKIVTKDYSKLRCAKCLPFCKYSEKAKAGFFTNCRKCSSLFNVQKNGVVFCYICSKTQSKPKCVKKVSSLPIVYVKPKPTPKPSACEICETMKLPLKWSECPETYQWLCELCHYEIWECCD
jgi:hypothetical protein